MNEVDRTSALDLSAPGRFMSAAAAKNQLLAWAEETDARSHAVRSSIGTIASRGAIAVLGGVAIAGVLMARRRTTTASPSGNRAGVRWISWALAARAGQLLLPYAIRAVQSRVNHRPVS